MLEAVFGDLFRHPIPCSAQYTIVVFLAKGLSETKLLSLIFRNASSPDFKFVRQFSFYMRCKITKNCYNLKGLRNLHSVYTSALTR